MKYPEQTNAETESRFMTVQGWRWWCEKEEVEGKFQRVWGFFMRS